MELINVNQKSNTIKFIWEITYAHVIAYFIAGIFALFVMNYRELFATEALSLIMKPVSDPIVVLGPTLQIFRGIILALAILPLRRAFFEEKYGYAKLGVIMLVFSLLSTIGPTTGSIDGYIYTTIPVMYQLQGYPEAILYILLFIGILKLSHKFDSKRISHILPVIFICIIIFMGITGYFST